MVDGALIRSRFSPFKSKSFRLLFAVQGVSLIGSWMQELARSWIVLSLMGRASSLGLLMLAGAVPNILFAGYGGALVDRRGARKILLATQVLFMFLAFSLGLLVKGGHVEFWHLICFALMEGLVLSFDIPAFNIVTPQLVPREDFQQAIALNAVNFHLSRMIGPSIAGIVMGFGGPAMVFWINSASFIGIVWAITRLPISDKGAVQAHAAGGATSDSGSFKETFRYIKERPLIAAIILQTLFVTGLVFPLVFTTLRVHIQTSFGLDAKQFGLVFSAPGLGALIGSTTFLLTSPKRPLSILPWGITGIVAMLVAVALAPTLWMTVLCLIFFSISMFMTMSALLVTVQLQIDHHMRGRISALTGMAFASLAPVMAAPMGLITDVIGARRMLLAVAVVFAFLSVVFGMRGIRSGADANTAKAAS